MTEEIIKFAALGTSGVASLFLASGGPAVAESPAVSANQWYWVAEKFGLLGLMLFGLSVGAWVIVPKAVSHLFEHLQKLENRNEASRQDFLTELREERKHRETALNGFKAHLESHGRATTDAIRNQTETLVKELKK